MTVLKRTTPEEMMAIVERFWATNPGVLSGEDGSPQRFFVVPRYNVLLRAEPHAIREFFSYMSLGGSRYAALLKLMLPAACRSRLILRAAVKAGYIDGVIDSGLHSGVRWSHVDALVAEWQFVACFSSPHQTVTHCLAHPKYSRCLRNEVQARQEVAEVVSVPDLKEAYMDWPSGYTERIIAGKEKVVRQGAHFAKAQAMLLAMYHDSKHEIVLSDYLSRLRGLARERYEHSTDVLVRIERLIDEVARLSENQYASATLELVRCHGDFNPNQIVVEADRPYLIDWSESEVASISHDLVYSAVFQSGWRAFDKPVDVPGLETLNEGLRGALHRKAPAMCVGIMLAEVGVKQHVDYEERRGTIRKWSSIVDDYLGTVFAEEMPSDSEEHA